MNSIFRVACLVFPIILLVACSGSGNSGANIGDDGRDNFSPTTPTVSRSYPLNSASARTVVDGDIPTSRTSAQISKIAADISTEADTLMVTDLALSTATGFTEHTTTCSAGGCTASGVISGENSVIELGITAPTFGNHPGFSYSAQPVMTKGGVETVQAVSRSLAEGTQRTHVTYAGWLDGSIFGISDLRFEEDGEEIMRYGAGFSAGNDSGTNPAGTGSATWNGLMIGGTKQADHVIQGDATIDIDDLASPDVDIIFSNVRNLNTGLNIADMIWTDLAVTNGRFNSTANGEIEGTFYGTTHQEVGGIFNRAEIIGGFGAVRQMQ